MKESAKKRTELLKKMRDEHSESVARTQALLKEHRKAQQVICKTIREQSRTVPEVAQLTEMPAHEVLWHITALKKYGLVVEDGLCGEYYLYQMAKETIQ